MGGRQIACDYMPLRFVARVCCRYWCFRELGVVVVARHVLRNLMGSHYCRRAGTDIFCLAYESHYYCNVSQLYRKSLDNIAFVGRWTVAVEMENNVGVSVPTTDKCFKAPRR